MLFTGHEGLQSGGLNMKCKQCMWLTLCGERLMRVETGLKGMP